MNSFLSRPAPASRHPRTARPSRPAPAVSATRPELRWIHDGVRYRVVLDAELRFERETAHGEWTATELSEAVFASTALGVTAAQWRSFLEYIPAAERRFLGAFQFGRVGALHVVTRCPTLVAALTETPALTPFLAAHLSLRGGGQPAWAEISAVFEREGIYGLLQWLGLPASPQTLAILQNIADPDLPRRLLEPLRAALWDPEAIWALSQAQALTDAQLARACHALAA